MDSNAGKISRKKKLLSHLEATKVKTLETYLSKSLGSKIKEIPELGKGSASRKKVKTPISCTSEGPSSFEVVPVMGKSLSPMKMKKKMVNKAVVNSEEKLHRKKKLVSTAAVLSKKKINHKKKAVSIAALNSDKKINRKLNSFSIAAANSKEKDRVCLKKNKTQAKRIGNKSAKMGQWKVIDTSMSDGCQQNNINANLKTNESKSFSYRGGQSVPVDPTYDGIAKKRKRSNTRLPDDSQTVSNLAITSAEHKARKLTGYLRNARKSSENHSSDADSLVDINDIDKFNLPDNEIEVKKSKRAQMLEAKMKRIEKRKQSSLPVKHPDLLKRTIYVGNVNLKTKKVSLLDVFKKYGKVESLRYRCVPVADITAYRKKMIIQKQFHPKRSSMVAYVQFVDEASARQALEANMTVIDGNHLCVDLANSDQRHDNKQAVFIGNLPWDAEEENLYEHFAQCGAIRSIRVVRMGKTGSSKGIGYVNFMGEEAVSTALQLDGSKFMGRCLRVKKAVKKPKEEKHPNKRRSLAFMKMAKGKAKKLKQAGYAGPSKPGAHRHQNFPGSRTNQTSSASPRTHKMKGGAGQLIRGPTDKGSKQTQRSQAKGGNAQLKSPQFIGQKYDAKKAKKLHLNKAQKQQFHNAKVLAGQKAVLPSNPL